MLKPTQARMARAALGWSLAEMQERTGINKNTVVRFEAGKGVLLTTAERLEEAYVQAGIVFLYETEDKGSGVLLSKDFARRAGETLDPRSKAGSRRRGKKGFAKS